MSPAVPTSPQPVRSAAPGASTLQVRVVHKQAQAEGITSFTLAALDATALPAYTPGAHIDVHLPASAGGFVRQYSLYGDCCDTQHYRIAVLREPTSRGGSAGMHDQVHEGDVLTISSPRNLFALQPAAHTLLLAGGIGITPLLSMAQALSRAGASYRLHYCTRSLERTAFAARLREPDLAGHVHMHHDDGPPPQRLDLERVLAQPAADQRLYVCGPAGFISHVVASAQRMGWPQEQIHLEYFAAPAAASASASASDGSFGVCIASTGRTYTIEAGQSIVEGLRSHGIDIMTSCEQGVCGTCITGVLQGEVDHRDLYLTDEEKAGGSQMLPCCSRARSPLLVLDL